MVWTWWQRDEVVALEPMFQEVIGQALEGYPILLTVLGADPRRGGATRPGDGDLEALALIGWEVVANDQTEGLSLALAAAACGVLGARARDYASVLYEQMRPYAGTAVVIRVPATALCRPGRPLPRAARRGHRGPRAGRSALRSGDSAGQPHGLAALRSGGRSGVGADAAPDAAGRREERVAVLLRNAEETALRLGLSRLARMAADPG